VLASSCPILHSWLALLPPKNLIQRDVRHFSFSTFPSLSLSLFLFSSWSCSNYSSSSSSTSQTCAQKVSQICTHKRVMRHADNVGDETIFPTIPRQQTRFRCCATHKEMRFLRSATLCTETLTLISSEEENLKPEKSRVFPFHTWISLLTYFLSPQSPFLLDSFKGSFHTGFGRLLLYSFIYTKCPMVLHKMLTKYNSERI
jgi:hypothetical protein